MTKEEILDEIRRTAEENGGVPLGKGRFEEVTGIRPYDCERYWARFGDAQREAGFEPNTLNTAYGDEFLMEKLVSLMRELGKVPTKREIRLKKASDPDFPSPGAFQRVGVKGALLKKVSDYSTGAGYEDIVELCRPHLQTATSDGIPGYRASDGKYGFVYLAKGHRGEYKIGRTNLVDRRLTELGVKSAVNPELVHEIKTDDPSGVEAYWHKRFGDRKLRGEWFKLNASDVTAFKKWRRIF